MLFLLLTPGSGQLLLRLALSSCGLKHLPAVRAFHPLHIDALLFFWRDARSAKRALHDEGSADLPKSSLPRGDMRTILGEEKAQNCDIAVLAS